MGKKCSSGMKLTFNKCSMEEAITVWNTRAYDAEREELMRVKGKHGKAISLLSKMANILKQKIEFHKKEMEAAYLPDIYEFQQSCLQLAETELLAIEELLK